MYQLMNPVYGYIIAGGLFSLLLLFVVIAKGDEYFCTNRFTKWIFRTFNPIRGSVLFWNGIFWILFVSSGLVWPEAALAISILLSIFFLAASFDENDFENQTWQFAAILLYILIVAFGIGCGIYWIWKNTIGRFNNYLDKRNHVSNQDHN